MSQLLGGYRHQLPLRLFFLRADTKRAIPKRMQNHHTCEEISRARPDAFVFIVMLFLSAFRFAGFYSAKFDQLSQLAFPDNHQCFDSLICFFWGLNEIRTIFRWITVKNLNTMQFDDSVRTDTPMGLLRGIKHGTESYHVLFKRICR